MAKNDPKWEHLVDFEQIISKNFINERLHGLHSCGWVVWLCQISIWRGGEHFERSSSPIFTKYWQAMILNGNIWRILCNSKIISKSFIKW
jgi:hypothetical protein